MKVKVYFNLHKNLFSVVALEGDNKGRVIEHVESIDLSNCNFRVQKAGREKVLREKRKNVHAYAVGHKDSFKKTKEIGSVKYNPYKYSSFVDGETEAPVFAKDKCRFIVSNKRAKIISMR